MITVKIIKPTNNPVENIKLGDNTNIPSLQFYISPNDYSKDNFFAFRNSKKFKLSKTLKQYLSVLNENEIISVDEDEFKILHVPGHSPGHIAFYSEVQKFIISGDVLFEGSIGRTDLYKGDAQELLKSIREKLFVLEDETKVYNGHGNPTTVGFEKSYNPFFK